jgi:hypothetical protein
MPDLTTTKRQNRSRPTVSMDRCSTLRRHLILQTIHRNCSMAGNITSKLSTVPMANMKELLGQKVTTRYSSRKVEVDVQLWDKVSVQKV